MNSKTLNHTRVLKIAIPIVFANATVPILGVVDTAVVGQLGLAAPIGAVGIGAIILSALYWLFGFLRMGTTGLAGQAFGANDTTEVNAILIRALVLGFCFGLFIIVAQGPLFWAAFKLSPATAEVEQLALSYVQIRIYSAPAAIALYGITGWLIAQERTKSVFFLQLFINGLNIILDFWFVLGLDLGVEGVAIATLIAEWLGLLLGLSLCRLSLFDKTWRKASIIFNRVKLKRMANVSGDIMVRSILLQAIFMSFLFIGSDFGDIELAANQILLQFLQITAYTLDGFAFSAESLVAQAYGANSLSRLRKSVYLTSFWGAVCVILLSIIFALTGKHIIALMTTAVDVREMAETYLIYMILSPLFGLAAWMLDGIFIGATRTKDMRNMMIISALIYLLATLLLVPLFGNHGLWIAMLISFVARGLTLAMKYSALEKSML